MSSPGYGGQPWTRNRADLRGFTRKRSQEATGLIGTALEDRPESRATRK